MQLDARTPGYLNDFFAKFPDDQVLYPVAQFFLHFSHPDMDEDVRTAVLSPKGGSERLANLFKYFPGEAISRNLVECVAQQKDYMKRLRGNGGARDILAQEGMLILWGGKIEDREQLLKMGFNNVGREVFYCIKQPV